MKTFIQLLFAIFIFTGCSEKRAAKVPYPDPDKFEIRGIDISAHNGEVDFERVKAQGFEFAIVKASEGSTFKDRRFISNVRKAKEAGLKVGAYHFFRFDSPGYIQGLNFASSLEGREIDLPAIIDLEEWSNPNLQATPLVMTRLNDMIDHLESRGYKVMLYTNKNGYNRFLRNHPRTFQLWLCSLGNEPEDVEWTLWQATHSGRIEGVEHAVDINAFAGTAQQWENFLSRNRRSAQ